MSIPSRKANPDPSAPDRGAELPSGPYAKIAVEHVLGAEEAFHFNVVGAESSRVTVQPEGAITIDWRADDLRARLELELTSPETAFLDGIVLGWRGANLPTAAARSLTYRVVAPPAVGTQAAPRSLIVELDRNADVYTYTLHVAYPTGESDRIDPKIYNEGDGGRR